jgi:DNA-binding beta-propeller fold protein YncE
MLNFNRFSTAQVALAKCLGVLLLLTFAGCASKPAAPSKVLFYPPAPDVPRFQYLMGFSTEAECFGQSGFRRFVIGRSRVEKYVGKPYGIVARSNEVAFCDTGFSGVGILNLAKGRMDQLIPTRADRMQGPINAAWDAQGNLYVTDTEREQVLIFDPDQTPLVPMGRKDEMKPCGIAIVGNTLYLTDLKSHQVRIYSLPDRQLVRTIPRADDQGEGRLFLPVNVAVGMDGKVYVSDPGAFCVQVFDAEGRHLRKLGEQGVGPGKFARPRGLALDRENRLYVVDAATQRVQLFDREGRLLIYLGDPSVMGPGSTHLPAGVAVDYENVAYFQKYAAPGKQLEYVLYLTNQYGEPRISVYGFLKQPATTESK